MQTGPRMPPVKTMPANNHRSEGPTGDSRCDATDLRLNSTSNARSPRPAPRYNSPAMSRGPASGSSSFESGELTPNSVAAVTPYTPPRKFGEEQSPCRSEGFNQSSICYWHILLAPLSSHPCHFHYLFLLPGWYQDRTNQPHLRPS